jgi:ATP-dependent Clp protease adapter protein ClpS
MAILILVTGSVVLGLLLYLPFALWFRRRRQRGESVGPEIRYTRTGYVFAFAMLAAFAGGLGARALAPDSWFANLIRGDVGAIRWGIGVFFTFQLVEMILRRAEVKLLKAPPQHANPPDGALGAIARQPRARKIATINGVPIMMRGSFPTTGVLIACFADVGLVGTISYCIAFAILILVHELGHWAAARAQGLKVFAVVISGVGGSCLTQLPRGVRDTFVLYAGGLIAQAALLMITLMIIAVLGDPTSQIWRATAAAFTIVNLLLMGMNLVPGKIRDDLSNDGAILWDLLRHVVGRGAHPLATQHAASPVFHPETRLMTIDGMIPPGFEVGVEILNDDGTPMEFVVEILENHLSLDHESAISAMMRIHKHGGQLFPLDDRTRAEEVADGVMKEARHLGHPLQCRAVWVPE